MGDGNSAADIPDAWLVKISSEGDISKSQLQEPDIFSRGSHHVQCDSRHEHTALAAISLATPRIDGWRVCWIGGWDKCGVLFVNLQRWVLSPHKKGSRQLIGCRMARDEYPNLSADSISFQTRVPYDANKLVDTFWDLGYFDNVAIWLAQSIGFEFPFIEFVQGSQQSLQYYLRELQSRPYVYGTDHLPWDGGTPSLQTGRAFATR
jgi:hypothetical protein